MMWAEPHGRGWIIVGFPAVIYLTKRACLKAIRECGL